MTNRLTWVYWVMMVCGMAAGGRAADEVKDPSGEAFGGLKLGQGAAAVALVLGEPEARGKEELWEATGEWVQEWEFRKRGMRVAMASGERGGAKTVQSITAGRGCELATARGIRIGSTEAEAVKAYGKERDAEQSRAGEVLVAGTVYGGVIFTIRGGKVAEIFIGAAAE